jgi:hypothetical protein
MLSSIALFLATKLGRYVFAGGVFVALVVGYTFQQRSIGARNAVAKIEAKNNEAVSIAGKAGSASRNPTSRGVRDPYTTD